MDCQFDRLSDCILLTLLEYLDSTSLYQLSQTNTRFQQLALENSLWKKIDARTSPNDENKINYVLDRVHSSTDTLLLRGRLVYPRLVEKMQLSSFSNLTIMALEKQIISKKVKLSSFPKSLVELSFKNTFFESSSEFFWKSLEAMENLKVLIIDGCININSSVIMSVSKYPNLEIFSSYNCPIENSVAYFSIAVSSGFKKIKVIDVRLSGLGNTFLTSMMRKANTMILYFQNSDTSYELDFQNRANEASNMNLQVPKVQFHRSSLMGNEENLITDFGTLEFSRTVADYKENKIPKSFLYTYPYPPCTCGFKERQEELKLVPGEAESTHIVRYKRGEERSLVNVVYGEDSDDEIVECLERGVNTENINTETGQSSDNSGDLKECKSTGPSNDTTSTLDLCSGVPNQSESEASCSCTEIIHRAISRRKITIDRCVGTDITIDPWFEPLDIGVMETILGTGLPLYRFNDSVEYDVSSRDVPSTSGLSEPLRKRKLTDIDQEGCKRVKGNDSSSSSEDDDEDETRKMDVDVKLNIPSLPSSSSGNGDKTDETDKKRSDERVLFISRGVASSQRIGETVSSLLNVDRSRRQAESANDNSIDINTLRAQGALAGRRPAQPARTRVYPCACGVHSVIVVTADETDEGEGSPLNPPENHFHPQHCEQRINLNDHQSLRVINRNEFINARPEIELVEINKGKSMKTALRHLSFRGYHRVTDLTLRNVGHLHLELLDVTYTGCTRKGIQDFLRLNPNCRVLHKNFCICKPRMDF